MALLASKSTDGQRTKVFSLAIMLGLLGGALGSLLSSLPPWIEVAFGTSRTDSFRPLFLLGSGMAFGSMITIARVKEEAVRTDRDKIQIVPRRSLAAVARFSLPMGVNSLSDGLVSPLIPLWFHLRFGVGLTVLGPVFAVASFAQMLSLVLSPGLASRLGPVKGIVSVGLGKALVLIAIPLMPEFTLASALYLGLRFVEFAASPIWHSYLMTIVHPDERATAAGAGRLAWSTPEAVGPTVGAYLLNGISLVMPFFLSALLCTVHSGLFYSLFRRWRRTRS